MFSLAVNDLSKHLMYVLMIVVALAKMKQKIKAVQGAYEKRIESNLPCEMVIGHMIFAYFTNFILYFFLIGLHFVH